MRVHPVSQKVAWVHGNSVTELSSKTWSRLEENNVVKKGPAGLDGLDAAGMKTISQE